MVIRSLILFGLLSNIFCIESKSMDVEHRGIELFERKNNHSVRKTQASHNKKLTEELPTDYWLNQNEITVQKKQYTLDISNQTKKMIIESTNLQKQLIESIKSIQSSKEIDERVIGFNIAYFNGNLYSRPFLGWNAK